MQHSHSRIYLALEEVDANVVNDPIFHMSLGNKGRAAMGAILTAD